MEGDEGRSDDGPVITPKSPTLFYNCRFCHFRHFPKGNEGLKPMIYYHTGAKMAVYLVNGKGEQFACTSVRVPRHLFDAAKDQGVNLSATMADALVDIIGKSPEV